MMQTAKRIFLSVLAIVLVSVMLLGAIIRFSALPLSFVEQPINLFLRQTLGGGAVRVEEATLSWNTTIGFVELTAQRIAMEETSGAAMVGEQVSVALSRDAFVQQQRLAIANVGVETLVLTPAEGRGLPDAVEIILPRFDGSAGAGQLAYITELAVRDIRVGDYQTAPSNGSHFLVLRDENRLKVTAQLSYQTQGVERAVNALADIKDDGSGHADIELNRLDPRDIGRFSAVLGPLRGLQLPVTALLGVDFAAGGRPTQGTIELFIEPGAIKFTAADLTVSEVIVSATADFAARQINVGDIRFNVGGVAGRMTGKVNYEENERGQVSEIGLQLAGEGIQADLPNLFEQKLTIPRAELAAFYDLSRDRLEIERFDVTHNFGIATSAGAITLQDRNPYFDITTRFGKMQRAGVDGLWPRPIAPRSRSWADKNVLGGVLVDGGLVLNLSLDEMMKRKPGTPLREDAMLLDLQFENAGLRYLQHLPPLQNSDVRLQLRGKGFEANASGGTIKLPGIKTDEPSFVAVDKVRFATNNYRDPTQPADIVFSGTGDIANIMRAVNEPPLNTLKGIDFDFDRMLGKAYAEARLNIAVFAPVEQRRLIYSISARTDALELTGLLGPYKLSNGRGFVDIDNQGFNAMGRAKVNGVDSGFAWQQPFGDKADQSRLALHGRFSPQDIADLDQAWAGERLYSAPHVNLLVNGPVEKPTDFRVFVDLEQAEMSLYPLAYRKPAGQSAEIIATIENNEDGDVDEIAGRLIIDGKTEAEISMGLDGELLTKFEMTPMSLGRDENVLAQLEVIDDTRIVSLTADVMDVSQLFAGGNRQVKYKAEPFEILSFLGDQAVANARLTRVLGDNGVKMDNARMKVLRKNGLHEELNFDGIFGDGTDMLMRIERDNPVRRTFHIQADRAGNVFRMFDWASEMYGGSMFVRGNLFDAGFNGDEGRKELDGRITITDFRARNVPVLASILTLASLTGIGDTLSGDGIKFDKAQGNFSLADGRLSIDDGRMHGAAVGLTMQGDYDIGRGDVDIGGTLVPAYSINSLLGKIPLVGTVLTGRRGEGVIGIGYRVSGEAGKANVLVNPLSVLTPGVFRRIFELGIGLGERDEEISPELDEPELTE